MLGKPAPLFLTFVDMASAIRNSKYPGLRIVGFSFDTWIRGGKVAASRGRPRPGDLITMGKGKHNTIDGGGGKHNTTDGAADTGGGKKKTAAEKKRDKKKRQEEEHQKVRPTMEFPPLADEQAQIVFDACADVDYPQLCPVEIANLAYRGADFECNGNCNCHHFGGKSPHSSSRL